MMHCEYHITLSYAITRCIKAQMLKDALLATLAVKLYEVTPQE